MDPVIYAKSLTDEELDEVIYQTESKMNHLRKNCGLALFDRNFDPDCIRDYLEEYEFELEKLKVLWNEQYDRKYENSISQLQEDEEE